MGSEAERVRLGLSLLAYAGSSGEPARGGLALHRHLATRLGEAGPTRTQEIIWGPASFRVWWQSSAPALVVFVSRAPEETGCNVVIRAGAPLAIWGHHFEAFGCLEQEPWLWARGPGQLAPAVCGGIRRQLDVVRELTPEEQLPGAGRSLVEFLADQLEALGGDRRCPIHVLGHGTGGSLAAAVALWLRDTQGNVSARELEWDPQQRAKLYCTAFAAPTIGNGDFASYIHDRLGAQLELVHNSLDHAVALWDSQSLVGLTQLYRPHVAESGLVGAIVEAIGDELERHGLEYEQPPARVLTGRLNTGLPPTFAAQAEYQHIHAYVELLGLAGELELERILDRPAGTDDGPVAQ